MGDERAIAKAKIENDLAMELERLKVELGTTGQAYAIDAIMAQKEKSISKREKEAFPKKKPVEKSQGGMATSRSRKPRGVGVALRGYGKALK